MPIELEEQEAIGRRIKRRRLSLGIPQTDLAAAVGKTQGWISKVEKGRIELDRSSLIDSIAAALHCHPNELIVRPYVGTASDNRWQEAASSILRELRRYDLTPAFEGQPRASAEMWEDMKRLHRLRDAAANVSILRSLPDLFREAHALAEASTGHEREEAFGIYAVCCKFAHTAAHALGHPELVATSCERASWAARLSGDPLMPAVADWMRVWDMWATADWADAMSLADKALRNVEPLYEAGDQLAIRVWGSLQLRAAVSAARARNTPEAEHRLGLARQASDRVDSYSGPAIMDRHSLTFSTGNVVIHGINVALEVGDQVEALRLDRKAKPQHLAALPNSRRGHHRLDLARAWLWDGERHRALKELRAAEQLAPQLIRNHPVARATLRKIVYAERASTREELRGMSNRFHLDDQGLFR
ncbi:XRE family transcriptional regulator [Streptomyces rimosus subsp. pseudoverticillatus]|uniref:helix-turn-helix domain-containing protein n=1 Tax=Streptomyces rimosus TaxID=1927 RepID=UPI0006B29999|nr:helix-turn-helix transcriptional regulator [Streptomyces rimosus]KOT75346.1 XRE family transcriptional regulator [Streptomyces rimosus subsp. pseudoverticillatus]